MQSAYLSELFLRPSILVAQSTDSVAETTLNFMVACCARQLRFPPRTIQQVSYYC